MSVIKIKIHQLSGNFTAFYYTYRNWSCGSLKTLDGSTANLFLFSLSTSRELEMFSKQPGSRTLILLLLKLLWDKKGKTITAKFSRRNNVSFVVTHSVWSKYLQKWLLCNKMLSRPNWSKQGVFSTLVRACDVLL